MVYAALGDNDRALEWFERGYEAGDVVMIGIKVSPEYDPVRQDPQFKALLKKMGLGK